MEHDVLSRIPGEECQAVKVPEEIWIKILQSLDPLDVLSLAKACRFFTRFSDHEQVWKCQWIKLSSKLPWFHFPSAQNLSTLGVHFKDSCRRLWRIASLNGGLYPKCIHCKVSPCLKLLQQTLIGIFAETQL